MTINVDRLVKMLRCSTRSMSRGRLVVSFCSSHFNSWITSFLTRYPYCVPCTNRDALIDYVEMVCKQVSKRFITPPDWWTPPTPSAPMPSLRNPDDKCHEDKKTNISRYCTRCQEEVDSEELARKEELERELEEKKNKGDVKTNLRNRMRMRAKAATEGPPVKKPKTK